LAADGIVDNRLVQAAARVGDPSSPTGPPAPILEVRGVGFGFGGVAALREVDLDVAAGECVALIGPNGAGKSTLVNCITRIYPPRQGTVTIDGRDCGRLQPSQLVDLGVKRTFQNIETFREMTVREVLLVGAHHLGSTSMLASVLGSRRVAGERERIEAEVARTAAALDLEPVLDTRVSTLPYGQQKKVDLARALVGGARLLLLDEPAAGLDTDEWTELADQLRATQAGSMQTDRPMGILLIEHQLGFVRRLADRLYALDAGTVIAQGDPASVLADRQVIDSYLGTSTVAG
jgi:branched-chain amino acid transport system ATP-binding protein